MKKLDQLIQRIVENPPRFPIPEKNLPRLLSQGAHAALGALNAMQNKVNPLLGVIQALALEGVTHTPFANSLAGGGVIAAAYSMFAADLAELDKALKFDYAYPTDPTPDSPITVSDAYVMWGGGGL